MPSDTGMQANSKQIKTNKKSLEKVRPAGDNAESSYLIAFFVAAQGRASEQGRDQGQRRQDCQERSGPLEEVNQKQFLQS